MNHTRTPYGSACSLGIAESMRAGKRPFGKGDPGPSREGPVEKSPHIPDWDWDWCDTERKRNPFPYIIESFALPLLAWIAGTRNRFADREPTRGTSSLFYQNEELHAPASFKTRTYQPWSETWD
jgi:hypothetical protein